MAIKLTFLLPIYFLHYKETHLRIGLALVSIFETFNKPHHELRIIFLLFAPVFGSEMHTPCNVIRADPCNVIPEIRPLLVLFEMLNFVFGQGFLNNICSIGCVCFRQLSYHYSLDVRFVVMGLVNIYMYIVQSPRACHGAVAWASKLHMYEIAFICYVPFRTT